MPKQDDAQVIADPGVEMLTTNSKMTIRAYLQNCTTFVDHLVFWKEGTFEIWDPLPWWWLYHVYWPGQFLWSILQRRKWSRINVSTTKVFGC